VTNTPDLTPLHLDKAEGHLATAIDLLGAASWQEGLVGKRIHALRLMLLRRAGENVLGRLRAVRQRHEPGYRKPTMYVDDPADVKPHPLYAVKQWPYGPFQTNVSTVQNATPTAQRSNRASASDCGAGSPSSPSSSPTSSASSSASNSANVSSAD
jgi:hypothetical protein